MTCSDMFENVGVKQARCGMKCPLRVFPKCHPKAYIDVFVDSRRRIITLVCGACDQTLEVIRLDKHDKRKTKTNAVPGK